MLPFAVSSGEDIVLSLPVDPRLLENVRGLMRFWHAARPDLRPVHVDAPADTSSREPGHRLGMFFSGGIDSTFTLLRHDHVASGCGSGIVDDLIFVAGLDVPISNPAEVQLAEERLGRVAAAHGKNLIRIDTNLKQLDTPFLTDWLLFYGCALGAVGHLLPGRFAEIIISAGLCYGDGPITGSHPIAVPLLGSRQLRFVLDGASITRLEKTQQVAAAGDPLKSVRVCWESARHDNCSRCHKCLLTMVTLDLAGLRGKAECFDWSSYQVHDLRAFYLETDANVIFFREVLADAERRGRSDVVEVLSELLNSSRKTRTIVERIRKLPVLWRFDYQVKSALLRCRGMHRARASI